MTRIKLKGINKVRKRLADGRIATYYYHRGTGKRIQGQPGTPEFIASYAEAAERKHHDRGDFASLITAFLASPEFSKVSDKGKRDYRRYLDELRAEFGTMPIAALNDHRVREEFFTWRDKRASTPRAADYAWSTLRRLLSWAYDRGKISVNHARGGGRLYESNRADIIWLPEHVDAFCHVANSELQAALMLALYTGQRQGDLLRLTWNQYDGRWISLRQGKTNGKRLVEIPVHSNLKKILDALPKRAAVILTTPTGRPWKSDYFRHEWREATKAANLSDLHFHDLRGTAVTMLAEAGCSEAEIASITGHSNQAVHGILEKYTARTRELARAAMGKLENAGRTDFANRLQTGGENPQKNKAGSPKNNDISTE